MSCFPPVVFRILLYHSSSVQPFLADVVQSHTSPHTRPLVSIFYSIFSHF